MKKLNGTEYTLFEIIELLQNDKVSINLDISKLGNENKPVIPLSTLNFREELDARDILYLLMCDRGGYEITHWLANYLELIGKNNSEKYDKPAIDKAMKKAANIIKVVANNMLNDCSKKSDEIEDEGEIIKMLVNKKEDEGEQNK